MGRTKLNLNIKGIGQSLPCFAEAPSEAEEEVEASVRPTRAPPKPAPGWALRPSTLSQKNERMGQPSATTHQMQGSHKYQPPGSFQELSEFRCSRTSERSGHKDQSIMHYFKYLSVLGLALGLAGSLPARAQISGGVYSASGYDDYRNDDYSNNDRSYDNSNYS